MGGYNTIVFKQLGEFVEELSVYEHHSGDSEKVHRRYCLSCKTEGMKNERLEVVKWSNITHYILERISGVEMA